MKSAPRRYGRVAAWAFGLVFLINVFPALRVLGEPRAAERLFWAALVSALLAVAVAAVIVAALAAFDRMTTSR